MNNNNATDQQLWLKFVAPTLTLQHGLASVSSLQAMAYLGLAHWEIEALRVQKDLKATDDPTDKQKRAAHISKLIHELQHDAAKAGIDAAGIIYAHAILDAVMHKLCCISSELSPDLWESELQKKQVTFSEIRSGDTVGIQKRLIDAYLKNLERESLLLKCDVIFRVLKPSSTRGILKKFKFSRERLHAIDQLRHDFVHKLKFHRKSRHARAKINYLFNTGSFFINLLVRHHGAPNDMLFKQV